MWQSTVRLRHTGSLVWRDVGAVPVSGCHERCCDQSLPVPWCRALSVRQVPVSGTAARRGAGPCQPAWECPLPPALVSRHRFFPLTAWQVCRGAPAPLLAHLVTAETERVACSFCRPCLSPVTCALKLTVRVSAGAPACGLRRRPRPLRAASAFSRGLTGLAFSSVFLGESFFCCDGGGRIYRSFPL